MHVARADPGLPGARERAGHGGRPCRRCACRWASFRPSSARSGSPRRRTRRCAPPHSRSGCRGWRSCCASSPAGSRRSSTPSARPRRGSTSWWPTSTRGCRAAAAARAAAPASARAVAGGAGRPEPPPRQVPPSIIAPDAIRTAGLRAGHDPAGHAAGPACRRRMRRSRRSRRGWRRRGPTPPTGRRSTSCRRAAGPMPSRPSTRS